MDCIKLFNIYFMEKDVSIIKRRKKLFDFFGWGYRNQPNRLFKNHWFNCGCSICRDKQKIHKQENRKYRHESKIELKKEIL